MDINNINRQYNIECIEKHQNDLTSVKSWVSEIECLEYNPITIFKAQGTVAVGWMISNREDTLVIVEFLKSIKSRVGNLKAEYVMSDDAEQFVNAWQGFLGNKEDNTKKLLCTWHVDCSWRRSLHDLVHVENERVEIYHHLRTLLETNNTSEFQLLLQHFITWLHNKNTMTFVIIFNCTTANELKNGLSVTE